MTTQTEADVMWTLEEGVHFVRHLETAMRELKHWTALGGGVLYKGFSTHDLDIVIQPLSGEVTPTEKREVVKYLKDKYKAEKISEEKKMMAVGDNLWQLIEIPKYPEAFNFILQATINDRKIDFFLPEYYKHL